MYELENNSTYFIGRSNDVHNLLYVRMPRIQKTLEKDVIEIDHPTLAQKQMNSSDREKASGINKKTYLLKE